MKIILILNCVALSLNAYAQQNTMDSKRQLVPFNKNKLAKQLHTGDTVDVIFARNRETKNAYGLAFLNYESSLLNRGSNCHIQGLVKKKSKEGGSSILTIEVITTNNCDSTYLHEKPMVKGQQFFYNMTYFNLKRHSK